MRLTSPLLKSLGLLSFAAAVAAGQSAPNRDALLVSPAWVASHLNEPNVVLLHVGDRAKYAAKHIAGARFIELSDIAVSDFSSVKLPAGMSPPPQPLTGPKNGLTLEMPTAEQLRSQLEKFGISDNSRIIVYSAEQWTSPSTRVVFTLDYVGLGNHVVVMDGGLEAWVAENHPVTDVVPPAPKAGKLSPLHPRPLIVDANYVRAHAATPGVSIVDARAAAFYDGLPRDRRGTGRLGHIPGAKSIPFTEVHNDDGTLKSTPALLEVFNKAGVQPGDTVVGYCHVGQQATAMLFAARVLGHPVLLYDGSFDDWDKHADFPVENPSAKKP